VTFARSSPLARLGRRDAERGQEVRQRTGVSGWAASLAHSHRPAPCWRRPVRPSEPGLPKAGWPLREAVRQRRCPVRRRQPVGYSFAARPLLPDVRGLVELARAVHHQRTVAAGWARTAGKIPAPFAGQVVRRHGRRGLGRRRGRRRSDAEQTDARCRSIEAMAHLAGEVPHCCHGVPTGMQRAGAAIASRCGGFWPASLAWPLTYTDARVFVAE
jgi:hypothetical protein